MLSGTTLVACAQVHDWLERTFHQHCNVKPLVEMLLCTRALGAEVAHAYRYR
jgi:hypothetical protein